MSEIYDVITKTTFTDFIRKNKEVEFAKDDKEYGGKWIKDFMGNVVFAYVKDDNDELVGLHRYAGNSAFLILYLLVMREDALIMTEYDPRFYDGLIDDGVSDPYLNYKESTQAFLDFVNENQDCQEWLKILA
jgi:hypothetical protein